MRFFSVFDLILWAPMLLPQFLARQEYVIHLLCLRCMAGAEKIGALEHVLRLYGVVLAR
jgi:hypothetical protein